ncbi:hypothetical protein DQ04_04981050 [Trypanosoma grayi]|uniref:hypothetical protein n=1 Tax=Trypanosoma grayi TaxID=71804 RepID=UPI0004F4B18D|nr:hypothetical protein DQ04_04981050 [Trypanosoma grayi]KEG09591.1 hypothetical protein DQ04_04981050 [Trypanosoma grayi]
MSRCFRGRLAAVSGGAIGTTGVAAAAAAAADSNCLRLRFASGEVLEQQHVRQPPLLQERRHEVHAAAAQQHTTHFASHEQSVQQQDVEVI